MPLPLAAWLPSAIGAAGQLLGAGVSSSGATKAAEIQAKYLREALAYEKQRDQYLQSLEANRYGNLEHRLSPYMALGQGASERIGRLLGLDLAGPGGAEQSVQGIPPYHAQGSFPGNLPGAGQPKQPAAPGATVMLRAPDGSTQAVPQDQVPHYLNRGAVPVQGATYGA